MRVALQDAIGPRSTRISVLVTGAEAQEIARRAESANLSVSAYLRAQALSAASPPENDTDALAIFDRIIADVITRIDAANTGLEAALSRLNATT